MVSGRGSVKPGFLVLLLCVLFCLVTFLLFWRILPRGFLETDAISFEMTVTAGALNVRGGPDVLYDRIASLQRGIRAPVLATDGESGWLMVLLDDGRSGWVSGSKSFSSVSQAGTETQLSRPNGYSRFLLEYGPALGLSLAISCIVAAVIFFVLRRRAAAVLSVLCFAASALFFAGVSDYFVGFRIDRYLRDTAESLPVLEIHGARELERRAGEIAEARKLRKRIVHRPIELFIEPEAWPLTIFTLSLFSEPLDVSVIDRIAAAVSPAPRED